MTAKDYQIRDPLIPTREEILEIFRLHPDEGDSDERGN